MPEQPKQPWVVSVSQILVRAAAPLVPHDGREDWQREWHAEIWHRWQFLFHTGEWNRREQWLLLRSALGAFADAAWLMASQEAVQSRISDVARSPFTCLAGLLAILLAIASVSSGLQATREMLFSQMPSKDGKLTLIYLHQYIGGGDRGLPGDVVPAWAHSSKLLSGVAGMEVRHQPVILNGRALPEKPLIVTASPSLFELLNVKPQAGHFPRENGVVLNQRALAAFARGNADVIGSEVKISGHPYRVAAVLPTGFEFLSRQPTIYLMQPMAYDQKAFIVARVRPNVSEEKLNKELIRIAEQVCSYYYLQGQMRYSEWRSALLTPFFSFGLASLLASLIAWMVFRPRLKQIRLAFEPENRRAAAYRMFFFLSKTGLGLTCVFVGCLEWSRSQSSVLLASRDPGSGPFLLWLYVLGTMGVLFWAVADQRARCRVCMRLMAFPVRIGCPGCLLLDWSGTELFCSEGHGLLHVPTMAPSWDEEADRWISLDDSWKGLFVHEK
jgi:MacB-like periplasmic core domain